MTRPYRDYRLTRDRPTRRPIAVLLALAILIAAAYYGRVFWHEVRDLRVAAAAARAGELDAAERGLLVLSSSRLVGADAQLGLGWVATCRGALTEAEQHFAAATSGRTWFWPFPLRDLALEALETGAYPKADLLARVALQKDETEELHFVSGMALNGLGDLSAARRELSEGPRRTAYERVRRGGDFIASGGLTDPRVLRLFRAHVADFSAKEKAGRRAYLFDREGRALAQVELRSGSTMDVPESARALVGETETSGLAALLDARDRANRVDTTVDRGLQAIAYRVLKGSTGVVIVIDMNGAIRAAASRQRQAGPAATGSGKSEVADPLAVELDIASVSKLVTLVAALESPGMLDRVFPFECKTPLKLDDGPFYDWHPHGAVLTVGAAFAQSCNLAFAQLALAVGRDALEARFASFGFAPFPRPPAAPAYLARAIETRRDLVHLGVGIDVAHATLVATAAMALAVATGGEYRTPYIIEQRLAIGGVVYDKHVAESRRIMTPELAAGVTRAMVEVVTHPNSTGHGVAPTATTVAIKTGTSGQQRTGLDAVITGFFPVEQPRYAFAVYLPKSGRASGVAARVVHELVDSIDEHDKEQAASTRRTW